VVAGNRVLARYILRKHEGLGVISKYVSYLAAAGAHDVVVRSRVGVEVLSFRVYRYLEYLPPFAQRLDSIAEFAGIGAFLDTPVKWYSSGMYVRLGFAVAAHLEPEILLVDEVLAVGDASFQARCLRRIHELRQRGTTILFISHDLGTVERLCDRVLLLERGQITADGLPADVVSAYQRSISDVAADTAPPAEAAVSPVVIESLTMPDAGPGVVDTGAPLTIDVALRVLAPERDLVVDVMVYSYEEGRLLCQFTADPPALSPGPQRVRFEIASVALLPGVYTLGATVRHGDSPRAIDWWFGRTTLHVERGPGVRGVFHQPFRWMVVADPERSDSPSPVPVGRGEAPRA